MQSSTGRAAASQPALTAGADGWRGIINEEFSVAAIATLGTAIGCELRHRFGRTAVLVAHDGRFYSQAAATAGAEALAAAGLDVSFVGHLSTTLASYALRDGAHRAAVVVTASHNPFYWNGVKLKVAPGMPPPKDLERAIDARRRDGAFGEATAAHGRISTLPARDIEDRYVAATLGADGFEALRQTGLGVAVDGLHGVAGKFFADLLRAAGCRVTLVGDGIDPLFGGLIPDPLESTSRERSRAISQNEGIDIAFAVDGDGDRLAVLEKGAFLRPHEVLALLLRSLDASDRRAGDVVTTVSTGALVRMLARRLGRTVRETPIGFKHIAPYLNAGDAILGGGAVGDIGCRTHGCDRDPFFAALSLLDMMSREGRSAGEVIAELYRDFGHRFYGERAYAGRQLPATGLETLGRLALADIGRDAEIAEVIAVDGVKCLLSDDSWILVRNASTERCLRIYAETTTRDGLAALLDAAERRLEAHD